MSALNTSPVDSGTADMDLRCCEQLALLTEQMLRAARGGQWASLGPLEARFCELVEAHRSADPHGDRDEAGRLRCAQLNATIQANHLAVRALVLPEMQRLAASLRSMEWQQNLQSAYSRQGHALL